MKAPSIDAVLASNGVIGAKAKPSAAYRGAVEPLHARSYTHAGLTDRTVVRLVQARVAPSEDASLAVLGFGAGLSPVVGQAKRRAIGFPAAAIVKAPELAKYALDITKDFAREARRIKSKPGHALQGFGKLADELGRSVPAFLPSFWEEAGRAFMANGSVDQAGQCFGKARAAEDVHDLDIDEGERHEAFLEFALAGALSIGSLTDYAKTLEKRFAPADAYQRFRALCRERVLGGLPPFGGMVKELSRLAKAAKLDVAKEDAALLGELLGSPAVARAPQAFWDAYKKTLVTLAQNDPAVVTRLLELSPKPTQARETFPDFWLELLESIGAVDALAARTVNPANGAAGAFDALVALANVHYDSKTPKGLVGVLERLAPRLVADGAPVTLWVGNWRQEWDLDLLERALALGVPVRIPDARTSHDEDEDDEAYFDLSGWAERVDEPGRGLDPRLVAADPRFAADFAKAVGNTLDEADFQAASAGKLGFVAGKRAYFRTLVDDVQRGGLMAAQTLAEGLGRVARPGVFDDIPEVHAELSSLDLVPALARTLRGGLPDELHWPAFEDALAKLGKDAKVLGPFPRVIVGDKKSVMVLGRDGVVMKHDVRLPKGADLEAARFIDGDLVVRFENDGDDFVYWASAPTSHLESESTWGAENEDGIGFVLPDGAWSEGGKAMVRGDTRWPETSEAYYDGHTLWQVGWHEGDERARELDPKTGTKGRTSLPSFFAAHVGDGAITLNDSCLYPVPDGDASPLGTKDGLAGWCVRTTASGEAAAFGIDGRAWTKGSNRRAATGLLTFPGHDAPLVMRRGSGYRDASVQLDDPSGGFVLAEVSARDDDDDDASAHPWASRALTMTPRAAWHYLRPRDEKASKVLRNVSDDAARTLVESAKPSDKIAAVEAVVKKTLKIDDPVLLTMVATRVRHAATLSSEIAEHIASSTPSEDDTGPLNLDLETLRDALGTFTDGLGWGDGTLAAEVKVMTKAIADPGAFTSSKTVSEALFELIGREDVLVALAASPGYAEQREALLDLFSALRQMALPDAARARYRKVNGKALSEHVPAWTLTARDGALYHVPEYDEDDDEANLYELALDGKFPKLRGVATKEDEREHTRASTWEADAAALVRARGSVPYDARIGEVLADKTGLSYAEAALLWAGLPSLTSYEKNFLPKALRESLGLKVDQAYTARESLEGTLDEEHVRLALLVDALPASAEALYTPLGSGPDDPTSPVSRLAAAWNARFGQRVKVDDALIGQAKKELGTLELQPSEAFAIFGAPATATRIQRDKRWEVAEWGEVESADEQGFDADALQGLLAYAAWIFLELPVGHPLRAGIPAVLAALRARVFAPTFLLWWGNLDLGSGKDWEKKAQAYMEGLGGKPLAAKSEKAHARDLGPVRAQWGGYGSVYLALVPARFGDDHAQDVIESFASKLTSYGSDARDLVRLVESKDLDALAARAAKTPVKDGGFEADPRASAPKLVAQVQKAFGVSADAAAYYLQLLVLPNASDARVQTWNGWSSKQLAAAAEELVAKELVVTGKRARAGREHFLPGGWLDLKAPHPPMELWKLAFHGHTKTEGEGFRPTLGQVLVLEPAHAAFARAWARVEAGDGPRFEEAGAARKEKKATKKKGA